MKRQMRDPKGSKAASGAGGANWDLTERVRTLSDECEALKTAVRSLQQQHAHDERALQVAADREARLKERLKQLQDSARDFHLPLTSLPSSRNGGGVVPRCALGPPIAPAASRSARRLRCAALGSLSLAPVVTHPHPPAAPALYPGVHRAACPAPVGVDGGQGGGGGPRARSGAGEANQGAEKQEATEGRRPDRDLPLKTLPGAPPADTSPVS